MTHEKLVERRGTAGRIIHRRAEFRTRSIKRDDFELTTYFGAWVWQRRSASARFRIPWIPIFFLDVDDAAARRCSSRMFNINLRSSTNRGAVINYCDEDDVVVWSVVAGLLCV